MNLLQKKMSLRIDMTSTNMLPLSSLPNFKNFSFIGVLKNGDRKECYVDVDEKGFHFIVGASYKDLVGWMRTHK